MKKILLAALAAFSISACGADTNKSASDSMPPMKTLDLTKPWIDVYCVNGKQLVFYGNGAGRVAFWLLEESTNTVKSCDETTPSYRDYR